MNTTPHYDLFEGNRSACEVYEALQRDYAKAQRTIHWIDFAFLVCAAVTVWAFHQPALIWAFLACLALTSRMGCLIDNAQRNWTMHLIDWMEHARKDVDRDA